MSSPTPAEPAREAMDVVVTGSSGLIGTALVAHLRSAGHRVRCLVRRAPASVDEFAWDPDRGQLDPAALSGADAVVHLAGAGIGDHRWTAEYKQTILRSRVAGTSLLARELAAADDGPRVLVSASGIGCYPSGDEPVDEDCTTPGTGFLADVVAAWEGATDAARDAGVSVTLLRTGVVLSRHGGALAQLRPLVRAGLGGPIGSGRQWWSWITLPDHVRVITRLLDGDLTGPVNSTSPTPTRQRDLVAALAAAAHRPAVLPAPAFALRLALGELADQVLDSSRVLPSRLQRDGFAFQHPDPGSAARWVMG